MPTPLIRKVSCPAHRQAAPGCSSCRHAGKINDRLAHERGECGGWTRCQYHPEMDVRLANYARRAVAIADVACRDGGFRATCPELPGPSGSGPTEDAALSWLRGNVEAWVVRRTSEGLPVPAVGGSDLSAPAPVKW